MPDDRWYEPGSLLPDQASYFAGGYLKTMLNALYAVVVVSLAGLALTALTVREEMAQRCWWVFYLAVAASILRRRQLNGRRRILESGILSIHSCSILWHAAVSAHYRALAAILSKNQGAASFRGYTHQLGHEVLAYLEEVDILPTVLER